MGKVEKPEGYEGRQTVRGTIKKINAEEVKSRHKPWTPMTIYNAFIVFENGSTGYGKISNVEKYKVGDVVEINALFTKSKKVQGNSYYQYINRLKKIENEYEEEFKEVGQEQL